MIVVLPTPGPPVTMETFEPTDARTARSCAGASVKPVFLSHHATARSGSMGAKAGGDASRSFSFAATRRSATQRSRR